jgi:hypothetical protein
VSDNQLPLYEEHDPPYVRQCPHCGYPCHDPERTVCRNCGAYFQTPLAAAPIATPVPQVAAADERPPPKPEPQVNPAWNRRHRTRRKQRHELLLEQWKREQQRRTPFAVLDDEVPSYQELAARFTVPYGRRLAELRSLQRRK